MNWNWNMFVFIASPVRTAAGPRRAIRRSDSAQKHQTSIKNDDAIKYVKNDRTVHAAPDIFVVCRDC
jgi:hypothetical protein